MEKKSCTNFCLNFLESHHNELSNEIILYLASTSLMNSARWNDWLRKKKEKLFKVALLWNPCTKATFWMLKPCFSAIHLLPWRLLAPIELFNSSFPAYLQWTCCTKIALPNSHVSIFEHMCCSHKYCCIQVRGASYLLMISSLMAYFLPEICEKACILLYSSIELEGKILHCWIQLLFFE